MKFNYKRIIAVSLILTLIFAVTALAKEGVETILAEYQNIQLVVDGVTVEPKDANGVVVEPFISKGTTYLPVRAVATAFGKDVAWDGTTSTVTLTTRTVNPDKEVKLWDRSYTYCSNPNLMQSYEDDSFGYMCWDGRTTSDDEELGNGSYMDSEYFEYALNGVAKNLKGEFYITGSDEAEGVLKIYADGNQLYKSPIMRNSTSPVKFDIPLTGYNKLKFVYELTGDDWCDSELYIKDATILTSDYQE